MFSKLIKERVNVSGIFVTQRIRPLIPVWPVSCLPTCSRGCLIGSTTDPGSVSVSACNPTCSLGCYPSDNPSPHPPTHPPTQHWDLNSTPYPLPTTHSWGWKESFVPADMFSSMKAQREIENKGANPTSVVSTVKRRRKWSLGCLALLKSCRCCEGN